MGTKTDHSGLFKKGHKGFKPKGAIAKKTVEFKEAVNNLLVYAAPQMVEWLSIVANGKKDENDNWLIHPDPDKALKHISNLAEYIYPKLSRQENPPTINIDVNLNGAEKEINKLGYDEMKALRAIMSGATISDAEYEQIEQ